MLIQSKTTKSKKVSIDFSSENYQILKNQDVSNSLIVNSLMDMFIGLSPDIEHSFAVVADRELKKLKEEIQSHSLDEYALSDANTQLKKLEDILQYFTDGKGIQKQQKMKRTEIKNGYVLYPDDSNWVVVDRYFPAAEATHVNIIEVKNGSKFNIPHFMFYSDKFPSEMSKYEEEQLYDDIEVIFPEFAKIRRMQVEPIIGEDNVMLNHEVWEKAPIIGMFMVPYFYNNPRYTYNFPFGAMVVKYDILDQMEADSDYMNWGLDDIMSHL